MHWEEHLDEQSEEHSGEHLEKVHSEENEEAHLSVMSIRIIVDALMTIHRQVDWSVPLDDQLTEE